MKTLLIMRHAKSSWKDPSLHDHDRPLNKRGAKAAPSMGRFLRERGLAPQLILCSTALRAKATAKAVREAAGITAPIELQDALYAAEPEAYIDTFQRVSDDVDCLLVVGHNPGLENLVESLTGEAVHLPTAAVAMIEAPVDDWAAFREPPRCRLRELWSPKALNHS